MTRPATASRRYYVYLVECEGGSLYTGITTCVPRRLREHLSQRAPGARYTRSHRVTRLVCVWSAANRACASALEYQVKRLSHAKKLALAAGTPSANRLCGKPAGTYRRLPRARQEALWAAATQPQPTRAHQMR